MIGLLGGWYLAKVKLRAYSQILQAQLLGTQQQQLEVKEELIQANKENLQLRQEFARLETVNQHLTEKLGEQKQVWDTMQEKVTIHFKNLANDLLEEKSKKFTDQNKLNLEGILKPLGERIQAFEKQVVQANKESLERNVALRTEVRKLNELNVL